VKIVLKNSLTGLYYGEDGGWYGEVTEARAFESINEAALYGMRLKLEAADVILRYEYPTCELTLPLEVCVPGTSGTVPPPRPRRQPS
jgi:hypothetical protein